MVTENSYSNKRIIKNTLFLYLRQIVTLVVSLYTSRIVLDVLGVEDFGLYNVIAGIVVLISIINSSMTNATQRFITFELGKSDKEWVNKVFSMSLSAHIIVCLVVFLIGETLGVLYIERYLVVPVGREDVAEWVYQLALLSIYINILRTPYNASVVAYEKMSFYAYMSIFDVVCKLLIVFLLSALNYDKLIVYSILLVIVNLLVTGITVWYCRISFSTCRYEIFFDKKYFNSIVQFLGWNLVGAFSTLGTQQAGNMIINRYVGVVFNAAYGTANQVYNAISSFVTNFQTAFTPQIVKLYAQGDNDTMHKLMYRSALLSFYLLFVLSAPLLFNIDFILSLWLKQVPEQTNMFILCLIICTFIDALQAPFWIGINATGNIKKYQIWLSILWITNVPLAFICLYYGNPAYSVVLVRCVVNFVCAIIRTVQVKFQLGVSIFDYFTKVIAKIILVLVLTIPAFLYVHENNSINTFGYVLIDSVIIIIYSSIVILFFGIGNEDRKSVLSLIKHKIGL